MTDDPIRAALDAAGVEHAAAIAAFLRALGGVATVPYLNPMTTRELAAAVERAAREAGDA